MKTIALIIIIALGVLPSYSQGTITEHKQKLASTTYTFFFDTTENNYNYQIKTEYIYDLQGKVSSELEYGWLYDNGNGQWFNTRKTDYTRDAKGNIILILHSGVSGSIYNKLKNLYKYDYTYDGNNNKLSALMSNWDGAKWINYSLTTLGYNSKNQLTTRFDSLWDAKTKQWYVNEVTLCSNDNKGNLIKSIYLRWNPALNQIDSTQKYERTFDGNNNLLNTSLYYWHTTKKQWLFWDKWEATYNTKGNRLAYNSWHLDTAAQKIAYAYKAIEQYDSKNNEIINTTFILDTISNTWVNNGKTEYIYDTSISSNQLVYPDITNWSINANALKSKILEVKRYYWDIPSARWTADARHSYTYSNFVSMAANDNGLLIFPNPASSTLNIEIEGYAGPFDIKLYTITGQIIQSDTIAGSSSINVSALSRGLYFLQVYQGLHLIGKRKLLVDY